MLSVEDETMTLRRAGAWAVVGVALVCTLSAQQGTAQSDRQFQAALQKETVDGNLRGAIEDYRSIAMRPGVARDLASQALLRMADAYQKLGDPQGRDTATSVKGLERGEICCVDPTAETGIREARPDALDHRVRLGWVLTSRGIYRCRRSVITHRA